MHELMLLLLLWISGVTGHYAGTDLPGIEYADAAEMKAMVFGRRAAVTQHEVVGVYDDDLNILFLPRNFDPGDVEHQAILVHELVHYLQFHRIRSGTTAEPTCRNRLEPEAYRLQNQWLLKHGRQPAYPEWQILLLGSCPEDWMLHEPPASTRVYR